MYVCVLPPTPKPTRTSVGPLRETHPQTDRLDSVNHANAGRRPSSEQTPRENIFFFPYTFGFCPAHQTPRYHRRAPTPVYMMVGIPGTSAIILSSCESRKLYA